MYRLWRVYQKNYVILLVPLAAWIGQVGASHVFTNLLSSVPLTRCTIAQRVAP